MKLTTKTTALGLAAVLLVASLASAGGGREKRDGPRERFKNRIERRAEVRHEVRRFVRKLELDDAQKAQALHAARIVQPIAESARAEARRIVADARRAQPDASRETIRAVVKDRVKAVRERAAAQILPQGRSLVASLTPDQRAKIEAALARRGKTFDAERAARRIAFLLTRPRAVEVLESRIQPHTPRTGR